MSTWSLKTAKWSTVKPSSLGISSNPGTFSTNISTALKNQDWVVWVDVNCVTKRGGAGRGGAEWSGVECIAVEWSVMWYNKVELTVNFLWGKRNESGWSLYRCTQSRLTSVMSTVCLRFYLSPLKLHRVMEYHQPHPVTKRLFTFSPFHSFSIAPLLYFPSSISFHLSSLSSCSIISGGEGGRGGEGEGEGEGGYSSARLVHLNIDVTVSGLDQSPHSRFVSLTDR